MAKHTTITQGLRQALPSTILSYEDLWTLGFKLSKSQLWRLERAGRFPKRIRIGGGNRPGWIAEEIKAHIAQQIAERDRAA